MSLNSLSRLLVFLITIPIGILALNLFARPDVEIISPTTISIPISAYGTISFPSSVCPVTKILSPVLSITAGIV